MRSRRDFLLIRKSPRRDLSQMSTKHRNLKVSGLERPRLLQFCAAKRPNSHVTRGLAPSPAFGPEVEDVMKINVREQRRNHRTLPRPFFLNRHDPVFKDAG